MRLLFIDTHGYTGGHHITYSNAILSEAVRRGWVVDFVVTDEAVRHGGIMDVVGLARMSGGAVIEVPAVSISLRGRLGLIEGQIKRWSFVHHASIKARQLAPPDFIYVVDCDGWMGLAAVIGLPVSGSPVVSLSNQARVHRPSATRCMTLGWLGYQLRLFILNRFLNQPSVSKVFCLEESLPDKLKHRGSKSINALQYLDELGQDPEVLDKVQARRALSLAESMRYICCFGIEARKGVLRLLRVLTAECCPDHIGAILVGNPEPAIEDELSKPEYIALEARGRLKVLPGYYGRAKQSLVLSSCDAAWLGYERFYSSSAVLCEAAQAGVPVFGTPLGWIGDRVMRAGIGLVANTDDVQAVVQSLRRLVEPSTEREGFISRCYIEGRKHASGAFGRTICDGIEGVTAHAN